MSRRVVLVDYDPQWPQEYAAERQRLLEAIGPWLVAIEHIGSTSVPGLAAKPIIDIMAAVAQLSHATSCIESLRALGYEYLPEVERFIPERLYFRKLRGEEHTHHLHIVEYDSPFWQRHLLFRDYLRAHPATAQEYALLKRALAARFPNDVAVYTEAKTAFIRGIEAKAALWSARGRPAPPAAEQDEL
ncbi:MAG: GrpB family protein [Thermogemmatispora sp.]|uniref:GrpB family protein n=1 Tax=Thermogemmatispora sp. TaxID=1968838 RepID=UPI0019FE3488|nr:GrpB family protein [Thermogemmatispora sp.]MBE3568036.1 GrpB family protein [Thermogemmatispora sp.]